MSERVTLAMLRAEARRVYGMFALVRAYQGTIEVYPTTPGPRRVLTFAGDSPLVARRYALETLRELPGRYASAGSRLDPSTSRGDQ